jgi:hypothetical protein
VKIDFEKEETWNLMSHIVTRLLEEAPLADSDKAKIRRWKTDEMRLTSQEMQVLTDKLNEDVRKTLERKTHSQIRRPDWVSPAG